MAKKYLIAGGAGFLGSHLCRGLLKDGHEVDCLDNLCTGRRQNIGDLQDNKQFRFVESDIVAGLPDEVTRKKYDVIVNFASPASPPAYQKLALETLLVGATGHQNLLEKARQDGSRIMLASTSEVYGDPLVHPQTEEYKGNVNSYGPRSMYDEAKRFAEAMTWVYKNQYGVDTVVARFFNTYGPAMDPHDGRVVSNFVRQALHGEPLTIYGDGAQTRSFCFVQDLIEGVVRLIDSGEEGPMNLGNPGEFTIKELADLVQELVPGEVKIEAKPLPKDDPLQRQPDITLAKEKLGWEPKVLLRDGLQATIDHFRESEA